MLGQRRRGGGGVGVRRAEMGDVLTPPVEIFVQKLL